jgi:hypothetical protein
MWRPCHRCLSSNTFPDADVQWTGWEADGSFSFTSVEWLHFLDSTRAVQVHDEE